MKLHRNDVKFNKQLIRVPNSSWLGFSTGTLRAGDFFVFRRENTDQLQLARMWYKHAGYNGSNPQHQTYCKALIIAQVLHISHAYTSEMWVDPEYVIETIPFERMNEETKTLFQNCLKQQPNQE